jgi:hypothetical protein
MKDINDMNIFEFYRVIDYLNEKSRADSGKFTKLNKRQKRMIKEAKNGK